MNPPIINLAHKAKLEKVLRELIVAEIDVSETSRRRIVQIVSEYLNVFAVSPFDIYRAFLITHLIDT